MRKVLINYCYQIFGTFLEDAINTYFRYDVKKAINKGIKQKIQARKNFLLSLMLQKFYYFIVIINIFILNYMIEYYILYIILLGLTIIYDFSYLYP
jgi:hypothetical protein